MEGSYDVNDTFGLILIIICSVIVATLWYKKMIPIHVNVQEFNAISEDIVKLV
jgi:hypothetical protein